MEERYIAALDVGTTTVRCYIFNSRAGIAGKCSEEVILHYPQPGYVEIDPEELLTSIVQVIRGALKDAKLSPGQLSCLSLSTQRGTFITWSARTGKPFHRFITWKDLRADKLVRQWNNSITMKGLRAGSMCLFLLSRSNRFRAGSVLKLMNTQTTLRLAWALDNVTELKEAVKNGTAMFGTLDTWLLNKLTGGRLHVSDASSASATGFFDPFTMKWAGWALSLFGIPHFMLPKVVDTAGDHFTYTEEQLLGAKIPIISSMADQTASMWGSCCFSAGDMKLTMGTGTFLNIHTGSTPHASVLGLYPLVGWKLGDELVYMAEGANNDTGSIVKWAQSIGLFKEPKETSSIATSAPQAHGVYFMPAFSGLGPPINDGSAGAGFIGIRANSTREHLVRAVFESIVFRTNQLFSCAQQETHYRFHSIRVDGGVSRNDFVTQLLSDLTDLRIERPANSEISALGAAFVAGLSLGIWKSKDELKKMYVIGDVFTPRPKVAQSYQAAMAKWEDAAKRFSGWYSDLPAPSTSSVSDGCGNIPHSAAISAVKVQLNDARRQHSTATTRK